MKGISIIIPTFNRENFIVEAIQSVLDQDYDGTLEVIISDDGSTDRTFEILESYGVRVIVLRKPQDCLSQGASSTRNRGIRIATQPYICFLDSDDFFLPGHLRKITSFMDSNPNLDFAFCRVLENIEQDDYRIFRPWTKKQITTRNILYPVVSGNNVICTNSFVFQRYVFDKVGDFNETFTNGEDADMWMRVSEQFRGGFSNHYGVVRRKHGIDQLTFNPHKKIRQDHLKVYQNALIRSQKSDQKNLYRNIKLQLRIIKYKLYGFKPFCYFDHIYTFIKHLEGSVKNNQRFFFKKNNEGKTLDYYELLHFYEE